MYIKHLAYLVDKVSHLLTPVRLGAALLLLALLATPSLVYALGGGSLGSADAGFLGEADSDYAGGSVAGVGDVNGDGYADLLIGASRNDDGGTNAGAAYLVLGGPGGWTSAGVTRGWSQGIGLGSPGVIQYTGAAGDYAGTSVAGAGDVNSDGYDDLLISASINDDAGTNAGAAYLVLGSAAPTGGSLSSHIKYTGEASQDYAGYPVAGAGDVNDDGYDDWLVGAYRNDDGGTDAGAAYLVLGSGTPVGGSLSSHIKYTGETSYARAGYGVAGARDANGDGYADLLIGAPEYGSYQGAAYLVLGGATPTGGSLSSHVRYTGEVAGDKAGHSVAGAGDVNGDGYADMLVGAPDCDSYQGAAYLVLGSNTPASTDLSLAIQYTGKTNDEAGTSVAGTGDVNGDGYADLLIGAPGNNDAGSNAGAAYLVLGSSAPAGSDLSSAIQYTGLAGDGVGGSNEVAGAGDVNGDGYADLLVGAPYNDDGGTEAGAAYLVFSDHLVPGAAPFGQRQRLWGNSGDALPTHFRQAGVSVNFTANALADGDIAVERHVFHPCNTGWRLQMPIWEVRSSKQNTGATPSAADLSFYYTDAQITGMTEANLSIWSRPVGQPCANWTELGGTVAGAANTITIGGLTDLGYQYTIADSAPSATAVDLVSVGMHLAQGPVWPAILLLVLLIASSIITYRQRRRGRVMASQGMDVTDVLADKIAARLRQPPAEG